MPALRLNDGAMIEYLDMGDENRPVLIFAHGWGVSSAAFDAQQELARDFRIIMPDLRGCGKSTIGDELSVERIGADIFELIEKLNLKNVHIIAWSMAAMALWLNLEKANSEIKSLTIIDMSPKISNEDDWHFGILGHKSIGDKESAQRLEKTLNSMRADWNEFAKRMVARIFARGKIETNAPQIAKIREKITQIARANNCENMARLWFSLSHCDARAQLGEIDIPTLLIYGRDNQLYGANLGEKIQSMIKNSTLVEFANCGHAPNIEEPQKFNQILSEFIFAVSNNEQDIFYASNEKGNGSFFVQTGIGQNPQ